VPFTHVPIVQTSSQATGEPPPSPPEPLDALVDAEDEPDPDDDDDDDDDDIVLPALDDTELPAVTLLAGPPAPDPEPSPSPPPAPPTASTKQPARANRTAHAPSRMGWSLPHDDAAVVGIEG